MVEKTFSNLKSKPNHVIVSFEHVLDLANELPMYINTEFGRIQLYKYNYRK